MCPPTWSWSRTSITAREDRGKVGLEGGDAELPESRPVVARRREQSCSRLMRGRGPDMASARSGVQTWGATKLRSGQHLALRSLSSSLGDGVEQKRGWEGRWRTSGPLAAVAGRPWGWLAQRVLGVGRQCNEWPGGEDWESLKYHSQRQVLDG